MSTTTKTEYYRGKEVIHPAGELAPYQATYTGSSGSIARYSVSLDNAIATSGGHIKPGVTFSISLDAMPSLGSENKSIQLTLTNGEGVNDTAVCYVNSSDSSKLDKYWDEIMTNQVLVLLCEGISGDIIQLKITNIIKNLGAGDVTTEMLADGAITSTKIADGAVTPIKLAGFLDMFYPVGSYYETSDTSFDPNISWGGTWSLDTEGYVTMSTTTASQVGSTTGNSTIKIITPNHSHSASSNTSVYGGYHSHGISLTDVNGSATDGRWFYTGNVAGNEYIRTMYARTSSADGFTKNYFASFSTANNTPLPTLNEVQVATYGASLTLYADTSTTVGDVNGGEYISAISYDRSVIQPSKYVYRWHRTA